MILLLVDQTRTFFSYLQDTIVRMEMFVGVYKPGYGMLNLTTLRRAQNSSLCYPAIHCREKAHPAQANLWYRYLQMPTNAEFSLNKPTGCHPKLLSFLKCQKTTCSCTSNLCAQPQQAAGWDCKCPLTTSFKHTGEGFAVSHTSGLLSLLLSPSTQGNYQL